jgi:arylsulfatase A-like enzyme
MPQLSPVTSFCAVAVSIVLGACSNAPTGFSAKGPNVLLISVDSLRRDHVSTYGYRNRISPSAITTPTVDRLAANGIRFNDAVSSTSWTLPSHMSLMTGLPDMLHGVVNSEKSLDPALLTLAELLQDRGYQTGGFFTGPNLHPYFGFADGFDTYESCSEVAMPLGAFDGMENPDRLEMHEASHKGLTSPVLLDRSMKWLDEAAARDDPFFLFVHWWDPHYDYEPPQEYADMFDPDYDGDSDATNFYLGRETKTPRDMDYVQSMYDAEIRYTDDHIGRLVDHLDTLGLTENTLIVFTADHGDEFYDHGKKGHQRNFYEESIRLPLVMSLPGVLPAGIEIGRMVRIQDLAPTILEVCDVAAPTYFEGLSLRALWDETADQDSVPKSPVQVFELDLPSRDILKVGLRRKDVKVTWDYTEGTGEVFNLREDPLELNPTVFTDFEDPELAAVRFLKEKLEELEARAKDIPRTPGHKGAGEMPVELEQDLSSAGYLGGPKD